MKRNKFYYRLLFLFSLLFSYNIELSELDADSLTFKNIDQYVRNQMKNYNIPGAALGILKGDSAVHLTGYGIADNNGKKVTPKTPFLLASITKSFTAIGIMQLVEEGKIDLDAPV